LVPGQKIGWLLVLSTKGSIGLNAGAIWNLLSDGQHWSFEALRAKSALTDVEINNLKNKNLLMR